MEVEKKERLATACQLSATSDTCTAKVRATSTTNSGEQHFSTNISQCINMRRTLAITQSTRRKWALTRASAPMDPKSSSSSMAARSISARLTGILNHLRTNAKHKVVVCRDLGPDVMQILTSRTELDVWDVMVSSDNGITKVGLAARYLARGNDVQSQMVVGKNPWGIRSDRDAAAQGTVCQYIPSVHLSDCNLAGRRRVSRYRLSYSNYIAT